MGWQVKKGELKYASPQTISGGKISEGEALWYLQPLDVLKSHLHGSINFLVYQSSTTLQSEFLLLYLKVVPSKITNSLKYSLFYKAIKKSGQL